MTNSWSWGNMEWICKWFIRWYSQQQWQHRSSWMILSTFESALVPRKHRSILRINATFSLAFIHALILLFGSFLLLARRSAVCNRKRLHSLLVPPKAWKHKWCERFMFHLKDTLVILPFLFVFILFMNSW